MANSKLLKTLYQLVVNNFLAIVAVAFATAVLRRGWPFSVDGLAGWLHAQRPLHLVTAVILMAAMAKLWRATPWSASSRRATPTGRGPTASTATRCSSQTSQSDRSDYWSMMPDVHGAQQRICEERHAWHSISVINVRGA